MININGFHGLAVYYSSLQHYFIGFIFLKDEGEKFNSIKDPGNATSNNVNVPNIAREVNVQQNQAKV